MERKPFTLERKAFIWSELFIGNWNLFKEVLQNRETIFVYDIDGILANSPKAVLKNFTEKTGVKTDPFEIDSWDYLTNLAKRSGLGEDVVKHAEDDWYKPEVFLPTQRYLYIKPAVMQTVGYYGADRNFALTSRKPYFKESTVDWLAREFPEIKSGNILIRDKDDPMSGAEFKVKNLMNLAKIAPWVVFVDDSTDYIKAAIEADIDNCLAVNIPLGKTMLDFKDEHLIVIKRFPDEIQAMYPLMDAINRAISSY